MSLFMYRSDLNQGNIMKLLGRILFTNNMENTRSKMDLYVYRRKD